MTIEDHPPDFYRQAVESSTVAFVIVGADAAVTYQTPAAGRLLRGPGADVVGELFPALVGSDARGAADAYLRRLAAEPAARSVFIETTCTLADGDERRIEITGVNLLDVPAVGGMVLNLTDRTEHHRMLAEATHASLTDGLTGLGSRRALGQRLGEPGPVTVLLVDLDDFKAVNDKFGHAAGDAVLATVGSRLRNATPMSGTAYRYGGEEFVIVLPHADLDLACEVADKVLAAVRAPSRVTPTTASIGLARSVPGESTAALMARADQALLRVKQGGKDGLALAEDEPADWQQRRAAERAALEDAMRNEAKLKADVERLTVETRKDLRTGLLNAAAFEADVVGMHVGARENGRTYAIALCDIDFFGNYNNRYLYHRGNEVLRRVADALTSVCRPGDHVYRYGGEELVVLLPDTAERDAAALAERLRIAVERLGITHENRPPPHQVTISVGVASFDAQQHATATDLLVAANRRLRVAKESGRNRVDALTGDAQGSTAS